MSFDFKFHFKSCEQSSVLIDHDALRATITNGGNWRAFYYFVHANDKSTVMSCKRNAIWDDLEAKMTGKRTKNDAMKA